MRRLLLTCLLLLGACAGDDPPLALQPNVDLQRYSGRWYIIANIPYFAEAGQVGSSFEIRFTAPDRFDDIYWSRKATLDAPLTSFTMRGYVKPGTGNAYWREGPFWPLYLSYLILYVDPEYRHALVGYPGRGYGRGDLPVAARPFRGAGLRHQPVRPHPATAGRLSAARLRPGGTGKAQYSQARCALATQRSVASVRPRPRPRLSSTGPSATWPFRKSWCAWRAGGSGRAAVPSSA